MNRYKKIMAVLLTALIMSGLVGCSKSDESTNSEMKVGMVTDAGTIDDKSFNQGTWEGILKAKEELNVDTTYLKPEGTTEADYLKEISNLYDTGYKFIVTPGYKFETSIYAAQEKYSDAKFILIDGYPHNGDYNKVLNDNTVSIFFSEQESGFLAGVATAVELQEGDVGFIGGLEIPAVQKYNWGFQQGVAYANDNFNTNITIKEENVLYQGSFDDIAAGSQLAAQMYDRGVKAIFCAAGGVGVGAINEAKARATKGDSVWIIGVDVDQYAEGIYADGKSVILTSAMKKIDAVSYDMIKSELEGNFPGGETLMFDASNDGIGIPSDNPNLSKQAIDRVNYVYNLIKTGEVKVSDTKGNLIK